MAQSETSREKLVSLQYLRALASIVVVGWHSGYSYTFLGQAGVDLFFIISGFVMMLVSGRENSVGRFGAARFMRIVPFYWLVTSLPRASPAPRLAPCSPRCCSGPTGRIRS